MFELLIVLAVLLLIFQVCIAAFKLQEEQEKEEFKKNDDGKPIKNQVQMEIFCKVHKQDGGIYSTCFVCPYQEECKQYYYRYDKRPYEKEKKNGGEK